MKSKRFERIKAAAQLGAVALIAGALGFAATSTVLNRQAHLGNARLTASSDFTITSTISSSASSQIAANLDVGAPRYLWYTVHNPLASPITVSSLGITIPTITTSAGCSAANLDLSGTSFSGSLVVPAGSTNAVARPISLNASAPDSCRSKTFTFAYTGSATYAEVYNTTTVLASSSNPSNVGQAVTYTATVTGVQGAGQDPLPSSPTGTVTFKDGATTICATNIAVTSASSTTATAQCTPPAYAAIGNHPITAAFTHAADNNFSSSTSVALNQVVTSTLPATSTALASSKNPSILNDSVTFTATVTKTSGSGTPTGTVSFYSGTPSGTHTLLGTGTLNSSAKATYATSSLPVGTDPVYAVYGGSTHFTGSTSPVLNQVVNALPATSTVVTAAPSPSVLGSSVTFTATVTKASGSGTPTGSVTFYKGTPSGTHTLLGTGTLNSSAKATYATSSLPLGTTSVYAVYAGDTHFSGSTSPVISQLVVALPAACTGTYNVIVANPASPIVNGTNGNDFIYAVGGNYVIKAGNGDDCIQVGDGLNLITAGNGNNKIIAGNGTNLISAGNGNNTVTVGSGSLNTVLLGNGANTVSLGTGSFNAVAMGNGGNTVTIATPGSHDSITSGKGNDKFFLGGGSFNTVNGDKGTNVCHLPSLPASTYHDTITNCSVVAP